MKKDGLTVEVGEHFLESHPFRAEETMEISGIVFGRSAVVGFVRAEEEARKTHCRFISTDHVLVVMCGEEWRGWRDV